MKKLHRLLALVLALALSLSLAAPAYAADTETDGDTVVTETSGDADVVGGTITGFAPLEESELYIGKKCALEKLTAKMPQTLSVHTDGSEELSEIPVSWVCLEEYESSNDFYFQFDPVWDEEVWSLSESVSREEVPYIGVYLDEGLSRSAASNKNEIFDFLTKEMGLNSAAACGVMANIQAESNFNEKVYAYDGSGSYGLIQWLGGRFTRLKTWCKSNNLDYTTVQGQMRYLDYELKQYYSSVYKYLCKCTNDEAGAYNAAYYWCVHFEMPANKEAQGKKRGNLAKKDFWPTYGAALQPNPVLTGVSKPAASINAGTGVSVYGTIACANKLTKVVAGVYDAGNQMVTGAAATPNTQFYYLNDLDAQVRFSALQGGTYTYVIQASTAKGTYDLLKYQFNVVGSTVAPAAAPRMASAPAVMPDPVDGVKVTAMTLDSISIQWNAAANAERYYVYISDCYEGSYTRVATVTDATAYTYTGLQSGKNYYLRVRANSAAGSSATTKPIRGKTTSMADTVTTRANVYVRKGAGTDNAKVGSVPMGQTLFVQGKAKDKAGTVWYKVTYGSLTGYVHGDWLELGKQEVRAADPALQKAKIFIVTQSTRMRKKASSKGAVVRKLPKYAVHMVQGSSGGWYKVNYSKNGQIKHGYVRKKCVSVGLRALTVEHIKIYKKQSASSTVIKTLEKGRTVSVLGNEKLEDGTVWYQISYTTGGKLYTGYCPGSMLAYY